MNKLNKRIHLINWIINKVNKMLGYLNVKYSNLSSYTIKDGF